MIPESKWKIIDALADDLAKPNARRMWRVRGVPHKFRIEILGRARRRGKRLFPRDFEASNGVTDRGVR